MTLIVLLITQIMGFKECHILRSSYVHYPLERLLLKFTPTNYVILIYEFFGIFKLVSPYVEIPHLCDCPERATVAPLHRYVWGKPQFQNVISYDTYMLSFQNLEKLIQTLSPKNNGKFRLLGAMVIMRYKALL